MAKTTSEADYLRIAKQRTHRAGDTLRLPHVLVYSRNKKGKTTFSISGGIPKTLVLDPEGGTDDMTVKRPHVWPVKNWNQVQEFWGAIRTGKLSPAVLGTGPEKEPFKILSCDGLSKINQFAVRFVKRQAEQKDLERIPGMVQRQDYFKSGDLMRDFINNLFTLDMGVVFTSQERMLTENGGDDSDIDSDIENQEAYFVPDLPAGVRSTINQNVDVIGRLYVVRLVDDEGQEKKQRRLHIGIHERYDTGYRSEHELPDILEDPTYPKLVRLLRKGK